MLRGGGKFGFGNDTGCLEVCTGALCLYLMVAGDIMAGGVFECTRRLNYDIMSRTSGQAVLFMQIDFIFPL